MGGETELGGRDEPNSSHGHSAQQESEQLRATQLSSKPHIDLCPPLIAIKKGKGENNKYFMSALHGKKHRNKMRNQLLSRVFKFIYTGWVCAILKLPV